MKKIYILAAIALVAGVSCTKQVPEANNSPDSLIAFSPITNKNATKAIIQGNLYPTSDNFYVWAVYSGDTDLTFDNVATTSNWTNFMGVSGNTGVLVSYNSNGYWAPTTPYYWPKAGNLSFKAVSPASMSTATYNWATKTLSYASSVTVTGDETQDDIMFSDVTYNKSEEDYNHSYTTPTYPYIEKPYDDDNNQSGALAGGKSNHAYNGVDILFHHTLAQIQFKVKKHSECNVGTVETIKVKSIVVSGAKNTGSALSIVENPAQTYTINWGSLSGNATYSFRSNNAAGVTVPENSAAAASIPLNATDASTAEYGAIVMPQTLGDDVLATVTFTSTIGGITAEDSKIVKLNTLKKSDNSVVAAWQPNKKYIYTLYFKENEIIFDPAVVDYDTPIDVDHTDNVVPAENWGTLVTAIAITPASPSALNVDETVQLSATITPAGASVQTVTWSTADASVATVSATGLVTAKGTGSTTITATANDGSGIIGTVTITVI